MITALRPLSVLALVAAAVALVGTASPAHAAQAAVPSAVRQAALRVMPLGDSITWGVGSSTGNGYRGPLFTALTGEGYVPDFVGSGRGGTMTDPDNEGHSGWRIDQIAGITDSVLATYKPDVVTLMIGTNDLNQNYQVSTAPDRLRALVDRITADAPGATVLLADLTVSTSDPVVQAAPAYDAAVGRIVQAEQTAGKHVAYVDMGALTSADLSDSLHPNDSGYQKMAAAWNQGIQGADSAGWIQQPQAVTGRVASAIAGKCLDVNGGSSTAGTAVQIWGCNGTAAQTWTAGTDGTLRAVGKCLDATANGTANGTPVEIWDCNGGANQQWQPYNGGFRNPVSGRCLDDPALSTTDGTQLELWDCNGGANQQWTLG
ncbi:SGNH/GDSL hydrolase family protein [Actinacidiphila acididurans]|uniref:Ricin-type beta-trefoil lectin domain protein n=1 Tax=Actinacidiphila acididurans TaxID=2784346 RepID=A0ABS2THZ7_9ACTN|nr:SGNH/GDSL hydrolase family protein [Actinacidiphila acididurans]MBM9502975.1 ricin-type beta-trefoil lectin domain protein [Actinacidiphila acididurans]